MASLQEIESQIYEMSKYLSELKKLREDKEKSLKALSGPVNDEVQKPLSELYNNIEGATKGSHIGAKQSESAITSASKKVKQVQSHLKGGINGSLCIGSAGGGGNMIHVTSDIGAVSGKITNYSDAISDSGSALEKGRSVYQSVNESMDTEIAGQKISQMVKRVDNLSKAADEFGMCLSFAQKQYRDCQEKAIALANQIPS